MRRETLVEPKPDPAPTCPELHTVPHPACRLDTLGKPEALQCWQRTRLDVVGAYLLIGVRIGVPLEERDPQPLACEEGGGGAAGDAAADDGHVEFVGHGTSQATRSRIASRFYFFTEALIWSIAFLSSAARSRNVCNGVEVNFTSPHIGSPCSN